MLAELRAKSQITIPKQIVTKLNLQEGDKFEIIEKDGIINLVPVTVYPKEYVEELIAEVKQLKSDIKEGKVKSFSNVDELVASLEK